MSSFLIGQTVYSINQPSKRGIVKTIGPEYIEIQEPNGNTLIVKDKKLYTNDPQIIIDNLIEDNKQYKDTFFTNKKYIQQILKQKMDFEGLNRNLQQQIYKLNTEIIYLNEIITLLTNNTSIPKNIIHQIEDLYKKISLL